MSARQQFVTATLVAQNAFTDPVDLDCGDRAAFSISGTLAASTVTIQRRFNPTGDWRDVDTYTAVTEAGFLAECGMQIRLGIKTGNYGGADAVLCEIKHDYNSNGA